MLRVQMDLLVSAGSSSSRVGRTKEMDMYIGGGAILVIVLLYLFLR